MLRCCVCLRGATPSSRADQHDDSPEREFTGSSSDGSDSGEVVTSRGAAVVLEVETHAWRRRTVLELKRELLVRYAKSVEGRRALSERASLRQILQGQSSERSEDSHRSRRRGPGSAQTQLGWLQRGNARRRNSLLALEDQLKLSHYLGNSEDEHAHESGSGETLLVLWRLPAVSANTRTERLHDLSDRARNDAFLRACEDFEIDDCSDGHENDDELDAVAAFEAKALLAVSELTKPVVSPPPGCLLAGENVLWRSQRASRLEMVLFERQDSGLISAITTSCVLFCTQFSVILVASDRSSYSDEMSRIIRVTLPAIREVKSTERFDNSLQIDLWSSDFRLVRLISTQEGLDEKLDQAVRKSTSHCFAREFYKASSSTTGIERPQRGGSFLSPPVLDRDSALQFDSREDESDDSVEGAENGFWQLREDLRLDFGAGWRLASANSSFSVSSNYPAAFRVPRDLEDDDIVQAAELFKDGRLPACIYKHAVSGASLVRSGAFAPIPVTPAGPRRARSNMGSLRRQALFDSVKRACVVQEGLTFLWEHQENSEELDRSAMHVSLGLAGEAIRNRFDRFHELCLTMHGFANDGLFGTSSDIDEDWLAELHKSGFLSDIQKILISAITVAELLRGGTAVVIVEEESDFSLVSILCVTALAMVDPYYRTLNGFTELFDSVFVAFISEGCDLSWETTFLCNVIWELTCQYPNEFEFNSCMLEWLATQAMVRLAGQFAFGCAKAREEQSAGDTTFSLWELMANDPVAGLSNQTYAPVSLAASSAALLPNVRIWALRFWNEFYFRHVDPRLGAGVSAVGQIQIGSSEMSATESDAGSVASLVTPSVEKRLLELIVDTQRISQEAAAKDERIAELERNLAELEEAKQGALSQLRATVTSSFQTASRRKGKGRRRGSVSEGKGGRRRTSSRSNAKRIVLMSGSLRVRLKGRFKDRFVKLLGSDDPPTSVIEICKVEGSEVVETITLSAQSHVCKGDKKKEFHIADIEGRQKPLRFESSDNRDAWLNAVIKSLDIFLVTPEVPEEHDPESFQKRSPRLVTKNRKRRPKPADQKDQTQEPPLSDMPGASMSSSSEDELAKLVAQYRPLSLPSSDVSASSSRDQSFIAMRDSSCEDSKIVPWKHQKAGDEI